MPILVTLSTASHPTYVTPSRLLLPMDEINRRKPEHTPIFNPPQSDQAPAAAIGVRKCSATIRRWIFPVAVFGRESVMNTFFGTLKEARFFLQNRITSASSIELPSLGIIAQLICRSIG